MLKICAADPRQIFPERADIPGRGCCNVQSWPPLPWPCCRSARPRFPERVKICAVNDPRPPWPCQDPGTWEDLRGQSAPAAALRFQLITPAHLRHGLRFHLINCLINNILVVSDHRAETLNRSDFRAPTHTLSTPHACIFASLLDSQQTRVCYGSPDRFIHTLFSFLYCCLSVAVSIRIQYNYFVLGVKIQRRVYFYPRSF